MQHGSRRYIRHFAGENGSGLFPIGEAGAEHANAGNIRRQRHPARPSTRLQLLPPKPNELLITRRIRMGVLSSKWRQRKDGSIVVVFGVPGANW